MTAQSQNIEKEKNQQKQAAVAFLKLVVTGKIDEAYRKYVDIHGKHHNLFFPAGFSALLKAMKENHIQFPQKRFTIKHVLGDGAMVAVHSHVILKSDEPGVIAVHLFLFKKDKIVEMWDCGQPISLGLPNKDGAF